MWTASLAAIGAVILLRLAWSRPRRSIALNTAGWGLIVLATVAGWRAEGAWGATVAALFAMDSALLFLAFAAVTARANGSKPSNRRAGMLPEAGEPRAIGRRMLTFLLVALAGAASSIALALGARSLAGAAGAAEADANAIALFLMPLAWAVLSVLLLMETRRRRQIALLLLCLLAGAPAFAGGGA